MPRLPIWSTSFNAFVSYLDRQTDTQSITILINSFTIIYLCALLTCSTEGAHVKNEKYFITQDTSNVVDLQSARIHVVLTLCTVWHQWVTSSTVHWHLSTANNIYPTVWRRCYNRGAYSGVSTQLEDRGRRVNIIIISYSIEQSSRKLLTVLSCLQCC